MADRWPPQDVKVASVSWQKYWQSQLAALGARFDYRIETDMDEFAPTRLYESANDSSRSPSVGAETCLNPEGS